MNERLAALINAIRAANIDFTAEDIADAVWLSQFMPANIETKQELESIRLENIQEQNYNPSSKTTKLIQNRTEELESPVNTQPSEKLETSTVGLHVSESADQESGCGATFIRVPLPSALPDTLEIARALRPMMRRTPSSHKFILDEISTVYRIAEEGIWEPVLKPARSRWLNLSLVLDRSISMNIWLSTVDELRELFERMGAFRRVSLWELNSATEPLKLNAGFHFQELTDSSRSYTELLEPTGQHLVLLLSDCVSSAWYNGKIASLIEQWSHQSLVVIMQLLPEYLWSRTSLGSLMQLRIKAVGPITPNALLKTEKMDLSLFNILEQGHSSDDAKPKTIAVPVITLEVENLSKLAKMVAGISEVWLPGFYFTAIPQGAECTVDDNSSAAKLERFWQTASPMARKLARLLAASPVITLPVIRLVRQANLGDKGKQIHEAEVLLSGLLISSPENEYQAKPEEFKFVFTEHVRMQLLDGLAARDIKNVLMRVSDYVSQHLGQVRDFKALLENPQGKAGVINPNDNPIARITADVLARLGGDYIFLTRPQSNKRAPIRILHLSKLSFGSELPLSLRKLPGFLLELSSPELKPDLVVITGNISSTGQASQYKLAQQWIDEELLPALGDLPTSNVIIIPGNHEFNYQVIQGLFPIRVTPNYDNNDQLQIDRFWNSSDINLINKAYEAFFNFTHHYCRYQNVSSGGITLKVRGWNLGLARLCAIWSEGIPTSGYPIIGRYQLEHVFEQIADADVRVALSYYPLTLLQYNDRQEALKIMRHNQCRLLFHGNIRAHNNIYPTDQFDNEKLLAVGGAFLDETFISSTSCFQIIEVDPEKMMEQISYYQWKNDSWGQSFDIQANFQSFDVKLNKPLAEFVPQVSNSSIIPNTVDTLNAIVKNQNNAGYIFPLITKELPISIEGQIEGQIENNNNRDNNTQSIKEIIKQLLSEGHQLRELAKFGEAINCFNKAISISEPFVNRGQDEFIDYLAVALMNKGISLSELGHLQEGLIYTIKAIEYYEQNSKFDAQRARTIINKVAILTELGRHSEAILSCDEAISIIRPMMKEDPLKFIETLTGLINNKGQVLNKLGHITEAIYCYDEVFSLCESISNELPIKLYNVLAASLSNKATALNKIGRYSEAIQLHDRSISYYNALVDKEGAIWLGGVAEALTGKGISYDYLGNFEVAIDCYNSAINIFKDLIEKGHIEFNNKLAMAMHNKGIALKDIANFSEALNQYDTVIEIRQNLVEKQGRTELANDLASTFLAKGTVLVELDRSLEANTFYDKALAIYEYLVKNDKRTEHTKEVAMIYNNKGNILRRIGQHENAIKSYDQAISYCNDLVEQYGHKELLLDMAMFLSNKALLLSEIRQDHEAVSYRDRSIEIYKQLVHQEGRTDLLEDLAVEILQKATLLSRLEPLAAINYYDETINYFKDLLNYKENAELVKHVIGAYNNKGNILVNSGDSWKGVFCFDEAIKFCNQLEKQIYKNASKEIAMLLNNKSYALKCVARPSEALGVLNEAIDLYKNLLEGKSTVVDKEQLELANYFANTLANKGNILFELNLLENALTSYSSAIYWRNYCIKTGLNHLLPDLLQDIFLRMNVYIELRLWNNVANSLKMTYSLVKPFLEIDKQANSVERNIWNGFLKRIDSLSQNKQQQLYTILKGFGKSIKKMIKELKN